jgi:hypothetical protein
MSFGFLVQIPPFHISICIDSRKSRAVGNFQTCKTTQENWYQIFCSLNYLHYFEFFLGVLPSLNQNLSQKHSFISASFSITVISHMHKSALVGNKTLLSNHACYSLCQAGNDTDCSICLGLAEDFCTSNSGSISRLLQNQFDHTTN